jgi:hypothetical protein
MKRSKFPFIEPLDYQKQIIRYRNVSLKQILQQKSISPNDNVT